MEKITIKDLAKYIGRTSQALHYMKKHNPKQFMLLWWGWEMKCKNLDKKGNNE